MCNIDTTYSKSPSKEVRLPAIIVSDDPRSTTCSNLRYIKRFAGLLQTELYSSNRVRAALPVREVPEHEKWRLGLMTNLFKLKNESFCAMLVSLCST